MKRLLLIFLGTALAMLCLFYKNYSAIKPELFVHQLLKSADITVNGTRPWDIRIHDPATYARVISQGSLGLGESYIDGWWDVPALDQFFYKIMRANLASHIPQNFTTLMTVFKSKIINMQSPSRAFEVGEQHYDLGDDLFKIMLDSCMIYSCAYWKNADCLDKAQQDKLDLICRKLELKPGMKLLDIGCGWGGLARHAAQKYGVSVVGITISKEQERTARALTAGLPVEIRLQDYRDIHEKFDRIASIGMFEHVGYKNYDEFMRCAHALLKDDGLMLLHTIGSNSSETTGDEWLNKYIFPNGMLPSIKQIAMATEGLFIMEDWHNFGADYDKTLMSWYENFEKNWHAVHHKYDERFFRMWKYYLLSCAGMFRARAIQLWQVVLSKSGQPGGYTSIR